MAAALAASVALTLLSHCRSSPSGAGAPRSAQSPSLERAPATLPPNPPGTTLGTPVGPVGSTTVRAPMGPPARVVVPTLRALGSAHTAPCLACLVRAWAPKEGFAPPRLRTPGWLPSCPLGPHSRRDCDCTSLSLSPPYPRLALGSFCLPPLPLPPPWGPSGAGRSAAPESSPERSGAAYPSLLRPFPGPAPDPPTPLPVLVWPLVLRSLRVGLSCTASPSAGTPCSSAAS